MAGTAALVLAVAVVCAVVLVRAHRVAKTTRWYEDVLRESLLSADGDGPREAVTADGSREVLTAA